MPSLPDLAPAGCGWADSLRPTDPIEIALAFEPLASASDLSIPSANHTERQDGPEASLSRDQRNLSQAILDGGCLRFSGRGSSNVEVAGGPEACRARHSGVSYYG